ncbi:hypothetical protein [Streptomyces sp. TLI_171]|uniref:hypothetical protein n=1 Tax=Streptomyces sp. TLI_171 TaxID=1938859 RepID=UPI000C1A6486|nr:hypothetical protein [Streptomyces sp. TLI_171]RKE20683.1 hypothetical protein BX266_4053 [Streptomyces sp. TLI_171]
MSQRRSYPNSGDFNLDDLFRPEPAADGQGGPAQAAQPAHAQPQPPHAPVPQQQSAPPVGQSGSPEYWGTPPQQPAAAPQADNGATQYLPPYPAGDPSVGGQQPGYAPQAAQPTYGGGAGFGGQQPAQQQPGYGQQTFGGAGGYSAPQQPAYTPAESGGRRKPDPKILIGAGVAGAALIAVLIGVLASGGDGGSKDKAKDKAAASQAASAPAGGGSGAVTPEMKAQAQAMSDLLGTASASRTSVVNAVTAVGKCQTLPDAQGALTAAAAQRQDLLKKLGELKVDQLPDGAKLVTQLQAAWQASSNADSEYALWAGDLVAACDAAKAKDNDHYRNGNTASGSATTAKQQAAELWGAIAGKTGLANKSAAEL